MAKKISMKEIAKMANVSITTVSNVIHGKRSKVSQGTFERIEHLIEETNYQLDARAGLLAGRKERVTVILDFKNEHEREAYQYIRRLIETNYKNGRVTLLYFPEDVEDGIRFVDTWNAKNVLILGDYSLKEQFCRNKKNCAVGEININKN